MTDIDIGPVECQSAELRAISPADSFCDPTHQCLASLHARKGWRATSEIVMPTGRLSLATFLTRP